MWKKGQKKHKMKGIDPSDIVLTTESEKGPREPKSVPVFIIHKYNNFISLVFSRLTCKASDVMISRMSVA